MSKRTAPHKQSSKRKRVVAITALLSSLPLSPAFAASLFANPVATDSAYAPVIPNAPAGGSILQNGASGATESRNTEAERRRQILQEKGKNKIGTANISSALESRISETAASITSSVTGKISQSENSLMARVEQMQGASEADIIGAVTLAMGMNPPVEREYTNPMGLTHVYTTAYDGVAVLTIVGAGAGGNAGFDTTPGFGGRAGSVIDGRKVNVPRNTPVYVRVGTGGAGAQTTAQTPGSGGVSEIRFGSSGNVAAGGVGTREFGCQRTSGVGGRDATNLLYFSHDRRHGAAQVCSGGFGRNPATALGEFAKARGGSGGGTLTENFYYLSGTLAQMSGASDGRFGGGGGGGAPTRWPMRNYFIDPLNGSGHFPVYHVPGGNGAAGYARFRFFDPNEVITQASLEEFIEAGGALSGNVSTAGKVVNTSRVQTHIPCGNLDEYGSNGGTVLYQLLPGNGSLNMNTYCRNSFTQREDLVQSERVDIANMTHTKELAWTVTESCGGVARKRAFLDIDIRVNKTGMRLDSIGHTHSVRAGFTTVELHGFCDSGE